MIGFEKVEKQWGQFAVKCKYTYCNDLNTLLFRQIFEPAQNGNKCGRDRHRIGGALRCDFLLAEKVRNANGEGSSWKSAANKTHM
jgi:hypothetical protein